MPTSDTDLANRALRLLKANRITSLTDGTKNANVMNDIFEAERCSLLRSHNWNFATKLATLSRSSETPAFEFDYGYVLPADWIRTIRVQDNDAGFGTIRYREAELAGVGVLLASVETLYLTYVRDVTDPNRMPPDFHTALVYRLACAAPGIGNITVSRETELAKQCIRMEMKARSADAQGSEPERRPVGSWVTGRFGGYGADRRGWW